MLIFGMNANHVMSAIKYTFLSMSNALVHTVDVCVKQLPFPTRGIYHDLHDCSDTTLGFTLLC